MFVDVGSVVYKLLLSLASAAILGFKSHRAYDHILISQI
jgi:hypothetical protein